MSPNCIKSCDFTAFTSSALTKAFCIWMTLNRCKICIERNKETLLLRFWSKLNASETLNDASFDVRWNDTELRSKPLEMVRPPPFTKSKMRILCGFAQLAYSWLTIYIEVCWTFTIALCICWISIIVRVCGAHFRHVTVSNQIHDFHKTIKKVLRISVAIFHRFRGYTSIIHRPTSSNPSGTTCKYTYFI